MDQYVYDIPLRVLIYKEEGDFVAHALEMDLLGYGSTQKGAMNELLQAIFCQISFAHQKKDAGLLLHAAPPELFERWETARVSALKKEVAEDKPMKMKYFATCVSIPRREIQQILSKSKGKRFTPMPEDCAEAA